MHNLRPYPTKIYDFNYDNIPNSPFLGRQFVVYGKDRTVEKDIDYIDYTNTKLIKYLTTSCYVGELYGCHHT